MNRHRALATGAACALAVVVLALLVAPTPAVTTPIDAWWQETMEGARPDGAVTVARVLSYVGGGWVAVWLCPILLAVAALIVRGWRTAIVVVVMLLLSTTTVQVVKNLVARERPDGMLVDSDFGSFPSGHAANAATIAVVLWLILPRVLGLILGAIWAAVMALSRTVLSVHWLSDVIGGALTGVAIGLLVAAAFGSWSRARPRAREPIPAPGETG
ncbi:hypothetical protein GCM10010915_19150 [Microbacterium faecale]|uniref:Phosphatidic acid phosphatase type 2/haloperoxidase domain-containing protein n=1 Tax=Microbacterium faecale TaxID=1804630 RepID=A0A916YC75_9MICO|nr:phosphatase PAP2 family protein [Microbacterium faecale]GGD38499.1 hypothetical protein GCM10010915_19150 [Microbacterium faecale]